MQRRMISEQSKITFLLEGVTSAATRACKQGKSGERWRAACQIRALLHALVAVFAVRHRLVVLTRANHDGILSLLFALGRSVLEYDLLTQ